jgi:Cft2 family RNA processing exonuclease
MRLTFHGAAGEVTGSCFEVDTGEIRFLLVESTYGNRE